MGSRGSLVRPEVRYDIVAGIEEALLHDAIDDLEQRQIFEKSNLNELKSSISQLEIQIAEQLKAQEQIREKMAETNIRRANTLKEQAALRTQKLNINWKSRHAIRNWVAVLVS